MDTVILILELIIVILKLYQKFGILCNLLNQC